MYEELLYLQMLVNLIEETKELNLKKIKKK